MYRLTQSTSVIRLTDGAFIPADDQNTDWQAYQEWLLSGNTPEPADTPTRTPVQKLADFLVANPDVLALINSAQH